MHDSTHNPETVRRHWLCIAYAFPPINRSGSHRTLAFVNHLDRLGWDATVLTVEPGGEPVDEDSLRRVPESTSVVRTNWVDLIDKVKTLPCVNRFASSSSVPRPRAEWNPDLSGVRAEQVLSSAARCPQRWPRPKSRGLREWVSRLLMTPDSRLGWVAPGVRAGLKTIRRRRPEVVYSTSPYMSAHLIGLILSKWTGLPWVADFRDPWVDNPFCDVGFPSLAWWDALLESAVVRNATQVVCCTPTMTEALCGRRPFAADRCTTILNGIDREMTEGIEPKRDAPDGAFVLLHSGQFYGPRSPIPWFAALRRLRHASPQSAARIRFTLLGEDSYEGRHLSELAAEAGVADMVRVLGKKCHKEALSYVAGADALVLAGAAGDGADLQIPNKLFEYLAVRRPVVATFSQGSPARAILDEAHADAIVCDPDDEAAIADAIRRYATRSSSEANGLWSGVSRFDRSRRAAELLGVFERAIEARKPHSWACGIARDGRRGRRPLQA